MKLSQSPQVFAEYLLRRPFLRTSLLIMIGIMLAGISQAQLRMENINRGVVAVRISTSEVYVGWRLLGTDPSGIGFNVYRGTTRLNASPITNATNYVDNTSTNSTYYVRPVISGTEQAASETVSVWSQQYLQIALQIPAGGTTPDGVSYTYSANDCSVGDLDGDGQYEVIVKWDPSNAKDNSQSGYTGKVFLDAYRMNGTRLWRIDLGWNIRAGAHYTQFMVYDLDSDGRAEVACKTADGTIDGQGTVIGSASADYRNSSGYVLSGPECLTIFEGTTGRALATTNYLPARGTVSGWGDSYGNRVDRFIAAVAYLDGQYPSLVMGRGYYTRLVRVAWDWRNGTLTNRWTFDSNSSGNSAYAGQGNHQMTVADVDNDGKQEIFNGSSGINDNGAGLYANGLGHGDALHLSDMDPDRAGLELWQPYESPGSNGGIGAAMINPATGAALWTRPGSTDIGRGMAADIDPRYKGYEVWAAGGTGGVFTCKGVEITTSRPSINFGLWWDADLQRELLDGTTITKWNYTSSSTSTLLSASGCASNNGTKATPCLTADLFGDWREEVIFRTTDNLYLRVYTTTITATNRIYTLMHDPQYRMAVAWQNGAYNQPPHPGFYLGGDMSTPPTPNIVLVGGTTTPTSLTIQENETGFCSVEGTIDSNNAGYTGAGFANANNAVGAGINWRVNFTTSGTHTFRFRYANGGTADRTALLQVNGATVVSSVSMPSTGAWTAWSEVSVTASVSAGTYNVRLQALTADGTANIDYLNISASGLPQAATCTSTAVILSVAGNDEATGARELLTAFPNPVHSEVLEVKATIQQRAPVQIRMINATGVEVYGKDLGIQQRGVLQHMINMASYPRGMYVVKLNSGGVVRSVKVVKE